MSPLKEAFSIDLYHATPTQSDTSHQFSPIWAQLHRCQHYADTQYLHGNYSQQIPMLTMNVISVFAFPSLHKADRTETRMLLKRADTLNRPSHTVHFPLIFTAKSYNLIQR